MDISEIFSKVANIFNIMAIIFLLVMLIGVRKEYSYFIGYSHNTETSTITSSRVITLNKKIKGWDEIRTVVREIEKKYLVEGIALTNMTLLHIVWYIRFANFEIRVG